jgi:2-C-methyl-D-erythritol 2,4-cyclodiphosphate synthase|tara:strand:- start:167 stop:667 length:501 start_codon:yes stop_codon:yes gene_type:complete
MINTNIRIGHGFDVHKFSAEFDPKKPLVLAGYQLDEPYSLIAHSDGDVVLHALCDALLGAAALGDIGQHFPDTDPNLAGIDSKEILKSVLNLLEDGGFGIVNIDITAVAEVPKLSPSRVGMLDSLCRLTGLDRGRVNLKATTTERMGYIGREEGIACHCVVLIGLV